MSSERAVADVVRLLARYFRDNPLACDTAENALRWWLPRETHISNSTVMQAFDTLIASGAVEALTAADGRVRYRRIADTSATVVLEQLATVAADATDEGDDE